MSTATLPDAGYTTSPQVDLIYSALAKAQAAFTVITKDQKAKVQTKTGPGYEYSYASLPDVIHAVRPALNAEGISILQPVVPYGTGPAILSILGHTSGQWIQAVTPFELPSGTPQQQGSAVTYWRRYSLQALLCIASEDDDGAAASTAPVRAAAAPRRPERPVSGNGSAPPRVGPVGFIGQTCKAAEAELFEAFEGIPSNLIPQPLAVERHVVKVYTGQPTTGMKITDVRDILKEAWDRDEAAFARETKGYVTRLVEAARKHMTDEALGKPADDSDPDLDGFDEPGSDG